MKLTTRLRNIANSLRLAKGDKNLIVGDDFDKEIRKLCYIRDNINGKIPIYEGGDITPSTNDVMLKGGVYVDNDINIKGDENLNPSNIIRSDGKNPISIFGVNGTVEFMREFNSDLNTNPYYGQIVADVARSYHIAKLNGVEFKYHQSHGILRDGVLTDDDGNCYLDCSSFISLVLRGIPFNKSPYFKVYGKANQKLAHLGLSNSSIYDLACNSSYTWSDKFMDKQKNENLKDIGIKGYKSLSNASNLAEYYVSKGRTLYDFKSSPSEVPSGLQSGDIIFWSKESASYNQKARYRSISHVGIVARDNTRVIHVTGSDSIKGDTVFYSLIHDKLDEISLIVRPNYEPISYETPINMNLLTSWGYDNCNVSSSYSTNGVEFKPVIDGGFEINRKSTSSNGSNFYLHKSSNPITLTPGVYTIEGSPLNENASSLRTTRDWGIMVKGVNGTIYNNDGVEVLDKGNGDTFTIEKNTDVYILFYCSSKLSPSGLVCKPVLKKKSRLNVKNSNVDNTYTPSIDVTTSDWEKGYAGAKCLRLIKGWEGFYDHAYQDCEGYWTIGYGITKIGEPTIYNTLYKNQPLSEEECAKALYETLQKNYGTKILNVAKDLGVTKQHQFDAMVSLSYSCGYGIWTNKTSTLYKTVKANINDNEAIVKAWEKTAITGASSGQVLQGLVTRRKAEAQMFIGNNANLETWTITKCTKENGKEVYKTFNGDGWLPS